MVSRVIGLIVCGWLIAAMVTPAEAQFGLFGRRRRADRQERAGRRFQGDPRHQRVKTEAEQAYQRGDYPRCAELASQILRENPRDHVAYYLRASARVEIGLRENNAQRLREGISDAREAIRHDPGRSPIYYLPYLYGLKNLAVQESRQEHAELAVRVAGQVLNLSDLNEEERANLLYQRAMSRTYLREFDSAAADFEEAIRISPTHMGAYLGLAECHQAAGKPDAAAAAYARAVEAFPDAPLVYNNRGMFLQNQGNYADAILDFTRAIQIDSNYFYAHTNRGFALMSSGDAEAAESDFSSSLRIFGNQPAVYNLRGAARLAQGDVAGAIEDQRKVLSFKPNDPVAHADLGFALFFAEDYAGALSSFDRALGLNSEMVYLNPWRCWSLEFLGKAEQAKSQFADVLKVDPAERSWNESSMAYILGGITEAELLDEVETSDEQVQNDQLCEAHFFIGLRKRAEGRMKESEEHFRKALETESGHLSAYRGAHIALKKLTTAGLR